MDDLKHPDQMLDAFLDGTLPPHEHARMLMRIESDPDLKAECERQAGLDASLARLFTPPAAPTLTAPDHPAPSSRQPRRSSRIWTRPRLAALAALLLIGLGLGAWMFGDFLFPAQPSPYSASAYKVHGPPVSFVAQYHALVKSGFKPDWVCKTQTQFAQAFQYRLGQPLLFDSDSPDIKMIGLSYANVLSPRTIVFLGEVHDAQAVVFVDRPTNDRPRSLPTGSRLHLFHKTIGGLILYELTPLNKPMLLGGFHQPAAHCP